MEVELEITVGLKYEYGKTQFLTKTFIISKSSTGDMQFVDDLMEKIESHIVKKRKVRAE